MYLGSNMSRDGDVKREINVRIGKASYAYNCIDNVWKESGMSLRTKIKLFNNIVMFALLDGCESWKGMKDVEERVWGFESSCLK